MMNQVSMDIENSILALSSDDDAPPTNCSTSFYSPPNLNCTNEGLDEIISTVGSFRRLILQPEQLPHSNEIVISCSNEYDMITESNIKRRKLTFNEEALSIEFIDPQRWKTENFSTIEEIIAKYSATCLNFKLRPSTQILDQLSSMDSIFDPLEEFHLRGIRLDSRQLDTLDEVLRHVKCNIINASKCSLEDDTFISICEMIEYYQSTKVIVFAHNPKVKIRGWIHLGRMIRKLLDMFLTLVSAFICSTFNLQWEKIYIEGIEYVGLLPSVKNSSEKFSIQHLSNTVEQLDIGYCAIDNFSLPMFLRCIRANCLLRILHLEGNGLSGKGIMILLAALKFNTNLKELYLGRNNLNPEDSLHIASIFRNNPILEVIDLRDNAIQDKGLKQLTISLIEQSDVICLNSLFLTNNCISDASMEDISTILISLTSIKTLSLSGNNIGNSGVQILKPALLTNSSLSKFGLRGSKITCEGAIAIAEVLAESKCLEVVDLRGNDIRIAGLMALSLAHKVNHFLLNLQIPENIKADQRDRQLIIDVLNDLVNYRNRNHSQREALFIAKSLEESLNTTEVGDLKTTTRETYVEHGYTSCRNSALEVDNQFSNQLDSSHTLTNEFLHGSLKMYEGTVLSADPDELINLHNSGANYSQNEINPKEDPNILVDIIDDIVDCEYKQLPDLLDEIPICREDSSYEEDFKLEISSHSTQNTMSKSFDLIESTPNI